MIKKGVTEMKKWSVELKRIDTSYVTVEVEADSGVDAFLAALDQVDNNEEDDFDIDIDLGHWEPGHIKEVK